jgi:hypothetical protein
MAPRPAAQADGRLTRRPGPTRRVHAVEPTGRGQSRFQGLRHNLVRPGPGEHPGPPDRPAAAP